MSLLSSIAVNSPRLFTKANIFNIDLFWNDTIGKGPFKLFSKGHLLTLCFILGIILLMYTNKETLRKPDIRKKVGRLIACILFFQFFFQHFWYIERGLFTLKESLPLYLCRVTILLCIFMIFN